MKNQTVRCFLGVPLDVSSNNLLDDMVAQLRQCSQASEVRWVKACNRHITLVFLGEQTLDSVFALQAVLQPAVVNRPGFSVAARSICGFPDAKSSIVALELEASAELMELVTVVNEILSTQGFVVETREYRPHVTLGRLGRGRSWQLSPQTGARAQDGTLKLPLSSLVLYQSRLSAAGAEYEPLWALPLNPLQ